MFLYKKAYLIFTLSIFLVSIFSCKSKHAATEKQIVEDPAKMDDKVNENIKAVLRYAIENNGKINDSIKLSSTAVVDSFITRIIIKTSGVKMKYGNH